MASEVLNAGARRVSPIFPADGDPTRSLQLGPGAALAFLYPESPRELIRALRSIGHEHDTWISHGLACVILVTASRAEATKACTAARAHLYEAEIWTVGDDAATIVETGTTAGGIQQELQQPLPPIDSEGLHYEAATQVRQFNSMVAAAKTRIDRFMPEAAQLVRDLHRDCTKRVESLRPLTDSAEDDRRRHVYVSLLVEQNATFSIFLSQSLVGIPSILHSTYPSGEYSLLGIGSSCRGLLRIYRHMANVFGEFNLPGRIQATYPSGATFNPFVQRALLEYSEWEDSLVHPQKLAGVASHSERLRIPYFSSRWGFRSTPNTISVSWQCVHACASREWNLLTFTHEYLHTHVKLLLAAALSWNSESAFAETAAVLAEGTQRGSCARESMRSAIFGAMAHLEALLQSAGSDQAETWVYPQIRPDASSVQALSEAHQWYVEEIAVGVLDYICVYDGDDDLYLASIWNSWALVPNVARKLDHYIQRTLAALSVRMPSGNNVREDFDATVARALDGFNAVTEQSNSPVIKEAIQRLQSDEALQRLYEEFVASSFIARLVRTFFCESTVHAALLSDRTTSGSESRYDLAPGDYREQPVESPIAFLIDRFRDQPVKASVGPCDFESLWQALLLVEPSIPEVVSDESAVAS